MIVLEQLVQTISQQRYRLERIRMLNMWQSVVPGGSRTAETSHQNVIDKLVLLAVAMCCCRRAPSVSSWLC